MIGFGSPSGAARKSGVVEVMAISCAWVPAMWMRFYPHAHATQTLPLFDNAMLPELDTGPRRRGSPPADPRRDLRRAVGPHRPHGRWSSLLRKLRPHACAAKVGTACPKEKLK